MTAAPAAPAAPTATAAAATAAAATAAAACRSGVLVVSGVVEVATPQRRRAEAAYEAAAEAEAAGACPRREQGARLVEGPNIFIFSEESTWEHKRRTDKKSGREFGKLTAYGR